jgi:hypothetical protein
MPRLEVDDPETVRPLLFVANRGSASSLSVPELLVAGDIAVVNRDEPLP